MHFVCDRENWDKAVTIHKGSEISYYSSTQCDPVEALARHFLTVHISTSYQKDFVLITGTYSRWKLEIRF